MASFPKVQLGVPCSVSTGHALLFANFFRCAALSNAAVDAAVVAPLELATLKRSDLTSTSSRVSRTPA